MTYYHILLYRDEGRLFRYGINAVARPDDEYPSGKIVGVANTLLGARFSCWRRRRWGRDPLARSVPERVT